MVDHPVAAEPAMAECAIVDLLTAVRQIGDNPKNCE
ncbi:MAG: hypothetical protein ACI9BH_003003 [Paracoccaceae bacterium]|jgi:hypothetical protein